MTDSNLYHQVGGALQTLSSNSAGLSVALSGGVDSVVLLHLCQRYAKRQKVPLEAIYIDHGLSRNAQAWGDFCQRLCRQSAVPFQRASVSIEKKPRTSIEAQAREARYKALDATAQPGFAIVLGQHGDDQLETFLLRLKRGSGLLGLGAMQAQVQLNSGRSCIRPMLGVSRAEIEAYAEQQQLEHINDESNQDDSFDRNFLRQRIIPLLKTRFTGFLGASLRSIELLQRQQAIIDEISQQDLASCGHDQTLCINALQALTPARRDNVLRLWLAGFAVAMPSQKQLDDLVAQAFSPRQDSQLKIQLGSGCIRRFRDRLYYVTNSPQPEDITEVNVAELTAHSQPLAIMPGKGCRAPYDHEQVSVRFGRLQDKIKPCTKPGSNTIKHWLKDAGVPSWQRAHVAVVYYDAEPVAVVGHFVAAEFAQPDGIIWKYSND